MLQLQPAPFYLFDEIDAALDEEYRQNATVFLSKLDAQIIFTTFRPQLLKVADQLFKVSIDTKQAPGSVNNLQGPAKGESRIECCSVREAEEVCGEGLGDLDLAFPAAPLPQ